MGISKKKAKEFKKNLRDPLYAMTMEEFVRTANPTMPDELLKLIMAWPIIKKSPYNNTSYYNAPKDWDTFVDGGIRVSDHWNFDARCGIHCVTNQPVENNVKWYIGVYNGETKTYDIVGEYPFVERKKKESDILREEHQKIRTSCKPTAEEIELGRKFKTAVKEGKIYMSFNDAMTKVIKHGFDYGKRFVKLDGKEEKVYIKDEQDFLNTSI